MGLLAWVLLIATNVVVLPTLEAQKVSFNVKGLIPAVFTPVDEDGNLNLDIIPQYAKYLNDNDIDGVLLAGTTGEGPTMTVCEKKQLVDAWIQAAGPLNLTVVIQVGGIPLPDAVELAAYSEAAGVDGILTLPELYYKPKNPDELLYFFQFIAEAAPNTPLLYYDFPTYSGVNVDMEEFFQLATDNIINFKGIKTKSLDTSLELQTTLIDDQRNFVANSVNFVPGILMGLDSFIMTDFSFFPELTKNIVKNGRRGNLRKIREQYQRLRELKAVITEEGNPNAAQKAAMKLITGIDMGPIRPPQIPLTDEQLSSLEQRLREEGIEIKSSAGK